MSPVPYVPFRQTQPLRRVWTATLLFAALPLTAICAPLPSADQRAIPVPGANTRHALCNAQRCVLVDGAGESLSSCAFSELGGFKQGLAVFSSTNSGYKGVINSDGKAVFAGRFPVVNIAANGLIEARSHYSGGDLAYYSRDGQLVRHFDTATTEDSLHLDQWSGAPVVTRCGDDGCTAEVIGADGQTLASFARLDVLEGGNFAAASKDGKLFGLVDAQLAWRGRRDYQTIQATEYGLLAERKDRITVLDAEGRELLPLADYQRIRRLETGAFMALTGAGQCRYFSAQGKPLKARSNDCALLGTITPQGEPQLPHQYGNLSAFRSSPQGTVLRDDLLVAEDEQGVGLVDLQGTWRIAPRYRQITPLSRTLVAAQESPGQWQILATDGTASGATYFELPRRARLLDGRFGFVVSSGNHDGLLSEDGGWVVPAQYKDVRTTPQGAVIVRRELGPDRSSAHLFDVRRNAVHPGPAMTNLKERDDGLIEGHNMEDDTRYLLTPNGQILTTLTYQARSIPTGDDLTPPSPPSQDYDWPIASFDCRPVAR